MQFQAKPQHSGAVPLQSCESAALNRDHHVKVQSVIGLPEAQDEKQTEQTRPGKAPVEPGQLCKTKENRQQF